MSEDERPAHLSLRERVFDVKGDRCFYCGEVATTIDHFVPRSKGGSDDIANLLPCCRRCNCRKGAKPPQEWLTTVMWGGCRAKK